MLVRLAAEFQTFDDDTVSEAARITASCRPMYRVSLVKKSIVAILVLFALVVLISPGLVGRLAEKSVDEQLKWAADENREIVVTADRFDRGWFSSAGRHRIELGKSAAGETLREALGVAPDAQSPALIIDTHLDHGLIAVTSVTREEGSLAPGLGRAVSTLSIETSDGEVIELPGKVYSSVGLGGGLTSHYFVEPGAEDTLSWGAGDVELKADARKQRFVMDGGIESISVADGASTAVASNLSVSTDLMMTSYGFATGHLALGLDSFAITAPDKDVNVGPFLLDATTALVNDRVNATTRFDFAMTGVPPVGDVSWSMILNANGLDAAAVGRLQSGLDRLTGDEPPDEMFALLERELADLVAGGFELDFDKLDITLPQGTVESKLAFSVPETARATFAWTGVLLGLEATADIRIPEALYEFATMMNPQANAAVATGFLKREGDGYRMQAEYRKGLLTVNGAPMPIPLPGQ